MSLGITTFGGVSILRDSEPLNSLASKKTEALSIYLAITRQTHSREVLADLLWDNRSQERAAGNLRVVLSSIRKNLGDIFDITRYEVGLKPKANLIVDAVEIENRINCAEVSSYHGDLVVQADQLDQAIALYEGEFLKNYYLREASQFAAWMTAERLRYQQLVVTAYCDLISLYDSLDKLENALESSKEFIHIDPLNEQAHRYMMKFLAASDQRSAALKQFDICKELLKSELGVEPGLETQKLFKRISSGDYSWQPRSTVVVPHLERRLAQHNLPKQVTSFVGRKEQLKQLSAIIQSDEARLVTLTGPGGVGKTRISLEAANNLLSNYPDGVFFVNIGPIRDPAVVGSRIARTINMTESSSDTVFLNLLKTYLKEKRMLLILDNFEQVISAAKEISELIGETDHLKIIVTSREPLKIYGEYILRIEPLNTPEFFSDLSLSALADFDAVNLFVQRAKLVNPSFRLTKENKESVAEICTALDGIPLGLELAAARTSIYTPQYISDMMDKALDFLGNGPIDRPSRHQKLRAALDWSYQLLDSNEKLLFSSLSIFQGGADLSCIAQIIQQLDNNNLALMLESLANKNLLVRRTGFKGQPRFEMLNTIDLFASEMLLEDGRDEELRVRHAEFFTNLVEKASKKLLGSDIGVWSARLRLEYDNLMAVLDWSFSTGDTEYGMRLFGALWGYWYYDGQVADGLKWLKVLIPLIDDVEPKHLPAVFNTAGMIYFVLGDLEEGAEWNRRALSLSKEVGDKSNQGWACFWLSGQCTNSPDKYDQAYDYCQNGLVEFEAVGDRGGLAWGYNQLGEICRLLKDYDQAKQSYEMSLRISRSNKNARREAISLINLSTVTQFQGLSEEAYSYACDGLVVLNRLGLIYHSAMTLALLAGPLIDLGKEKRAVRLMGASAAVFNKLASNLQPADAQEIEVYADKAKKILGPELFFELIREGESFTYEQAIEYAIG